MTTTTHYQGSKGPVEIETMPFPHLNSALAKLLRDRIGDERQDEVDAMSARLAVLNEQHLESQAQQ